ncbi:hypothetical protein KFL_002590070 [Klebsormidium nitens]|uniref:WWE domain-containing protein n=1 Tax=Klebsormidium nitens TaxID=105231 RepID=A0A1Y1I8Z2_KLENI|nr:hypothetical protein KFL_002590070 [Klebsormidium nitens]|eukprot:GAQ85879.1 hypothetical protein KFL_002590070 [Klebsormidium nitens]
MCIYGTIPDPVAVGVWFRDDYEWRLYDVTSAQLIKTAYVDAEKKLDLTIKSAVHTGGARYTVDLRTMRQTNCASGMQRPVKINMPEAAAVVHASKGVPMTNGVQSADETSEPESVISSELPTANGYVTVSIAF